MPVAALVVGAGCAKGETEPQSVTFRSGQYELSTVRLEGECAPIDAITPGTEFVGKLARVTVTVGAHNARLEPCDDFFQDQCMPVLDKDLGFSVIRDDDRLFADQPSWAPACWCDFEAPPPGSRSVEGTIVDDDTAELEWALEIGARPEVFGCECTGTPACSAKVVQRLTRQAASGGGG